MEEADRPATKPVYRHDYVCVHVAGPHRDKEDVFPGRLEILEEEHGAIVQWKPNEGEIPEVNLSTDGEVLGWEEVNGTMAISYRNGRTTSVDGARHKKKFPSPVEFEVSDIRSYRCMSKSKGKQPNIQFNLKDGSTPPIFYFPFCDHSSFLQNLEKYVSFKRSGKDGNLHLAIDAKMENLEKSFNELHLFHGNKSNMVTKFFHDPYSATLGGFSKVTNFFSDFLYIPEATTPTRWTDDEVAELLHESLPPLDITTNEEPGFEIITCMELPERRKIQRLRPLTTEEWKKYHDSEGRIKEVEMLKALIFHGGVEHSLRKEAWKFLFGCYDFDTTYKERDDQRRQKVDDYFRMKLQWKTMSADQELRFAAFRERKNLIEKDVNRTDRNHPFFQGENNDNLTMLYDILMTYCMYDFDLGYVQGMSDMLSPILVIMENEPDAFWCFAKMMEKIGLNFEMDQQGIKTQLQGLYTVLHFIDYSFCEYLENHDSGNFYFCFRWLLILFKREFHFSDIMRLWEVLWTGLPCKNFHILLCLAILDGEKLTLTENGYGLTEILKHVNDMSYNINLEENLCRAEAIYHQLKECPSLPQPIKELLGIQSDETETRTKDDTGSSPGGAAARYDTPKLASVSETKVSNSEESPSSKQNSFESNSIEVIAEENDFESKLFAAFDFIT